jgi:4-hydroxy-tetrahydrodipicolinate synthase
MRRDDVDWRGYWPAAPTPFAADGAVDEAAWRALLRLYLEQGVHGVLVNGTTGEWFSQTPDERRLLAEAAVDEVAGRVPVVVGCTDYTAAGVLRLARDAQAAGADGILATPPPYAVPTPREVLAFYAAIADGAGLPLMVYNWPRGTNVDIGPELAVELAALDGVVAIKDSTDDWPRSLETLQAVVGEVRVFGTFVGRRGLAVLRELGGDGNIDGGGLGAPMATAFYEAVWRGDLEAARGHADRYVGLASRLMRPDYSGRFASPQAQIKAAMNLLGQPGGHVRPPLLPLDDAGALERIGEILRDAGLAPVGSAA